MEDVFAPPGVTWTRVPGQLAAMRRTVLAAVTGLLAVALLVLLVVLAPWRGWVGLALVVLALLAAAGWVVIGRNARSWGYAEREEDLYITHGALFRTLVAVPYGRMQYVDVTAGPLEQGFGVATVRLHTASAGTNAHIPGLPPAEAARLRDRLTELGQTQAAGL